MKKNINVLWKLIGARAIVARLGLPVNMFPALIALNLTWIVFESLSIALLLPIFEMLKTGSVETASELSGRHWDILKGAASTARVPLSLGTLLITAYVLIVLRQIFNYLNAYYYGVTMRRAIDKLRRRIFNGFLRTRTAVQGELRVGEIANELTVEMERAVSAVFVSVRTVGTILQMAVYIGGLFLLSTPMTALSIVMLAVTVLLLKRMLSAIRQAGKDITDSNTDLGGFVVERLQQARLIRLSGTEKAEASAFAALSSRQAETTIRQKLIAAKVTLIPEPIAIGFAFTALYMGTTVLGLSLESLGLFMVVLMRLIPIANGMLQDYNTIVSRWPATVKISNRLRDLQQGREGKGGPVAFAALGTAIDYRSVSFAYEGHGAPALKDVSIRIPAHSMTALVGPSGSGKSTFVDLLPRLREPTVGSIEFDSVAIADYSIESLRAGIAFVPQQPQIFNTSAAEHIRYGKDTASDEEVREAARLAGALEFIEALPNGFSTLLGHNGHRLSGGQRQRLDIARALVRKASILILDEPTSALDADAEAAFRDALVKLRHETDLTIAVIAHRLSTISDADQIIVLRNGRVEAVGRHADLAKQGGWYADAARSQRIDGSGRHGDLDIHAAPATKTSAI